MSLIRRRFPTFATQNGKWPPNAELNSQTSPLVIKLQTCLRQTAPSSAASCRTCRASACLAEGERPWHPLPILGSTELLKSAPKIPVFVPAVLRPVSAKGRSGLGVAQAEPRNPNGDHFPHGGRPPSSPTSAPPRLPKHSPSRAKLRESRAHVTLGAHQTRTHICPPRPNLNAVCHWETHTARQPQHSGG